MIQCDFCGAYQEEGKKCVFCGRSLPQYPKAGSTNLQTTRGSGKVQKKSMTLGSFIALAIVFVGGCLMGWGLSVFHVLPDVLTSEDAQITEVEQPKTNVEPQMVPQVNEKKNDESFREKRNKDITYQDIMKDILARKIYKITPNDLRSSHSIEKLKTSIVTALENNTRSSYSDHFIIQMDTDLKTFKDALKKIQYEELYQVILKSNEPRLRSLRGKTPVSWIPMKFDESGTYKNPKTGEEEKIVSLGCTLPASDDIDYFRPALQVYTRNESSGLVTGGKITWFPVDKIIRNINQRINREEVRFNVIPDNNFIMGLDGEWVTHENPVELQLDDEMIDEINDDYLTADYRDKNDSLPIETLAPLNTIVKSEFFYTVDGTFLEHNGSYYFILSYRSYSLEDMRDRCAPMVERLTRSH